MSTKGLDNPKGRGVGVCSKGSLGVDGEWYRLIAVGQEQARELSEWEQGGEETREESRVRHKQGRGRFALSRVREGPAQAGHRGVKRSAVGND